MEIDRMDEQEMNEYFQEDAEEFTEEVTDNQKLEEEFTEEVQDESENLKRNVIIYKRRLKSIIESQLEIIEEMDRIDLRDIDRD